MLDGLRAAILRVLRVPPQPEPPRGAPSSVRVFRAGKNFYKLRLARWLFAQVGAGIGIAISLYFLAGAREVEDRVRAERAAKPEPAAVEAAPESTVAAEAVDDSSAPSPEIAAAAELAEAPAEPAPEPRRKRRGRWSFYPRDFVEGAGRFMAALPPWMSTLVTLAEIAGVAGFVLQIPVTFAAVRLDFEQHWYVVTDRSLRIRAGLLEVREATMSFANVQQVTVSQGPLQRWLGLADVEVRSAGGGSIDDPDKRRESMHHGTFEGVEHAGEIRDLILARLKRYREAGLGDPEDDAAVRAAEAAAESAGSAATVATDADVLAAARELLAEARALRAVVERPARG